MRMKTIMLKCGAVTAIAAALCGCGGSKVDTMAPPAVQLYTVETAATGVCHQYPGKVKAAEEVNMAFKVSGTLMAIHVDAGTYVHAGQLIAEIDPRDYQLQVDAAEAEYQQIAADAQRVIALYGDSVATAADYDRARYGLQQITAKRDNARNQLADTKIYAPFDGIVQDRFFDPPTVIGAGMPVLSIVSQGKQEIEINIPATAYRSASRARFTTAFDFVDGAVPLTLISIAPKANANQLYTVRLAIPPTGASLPAPGMNVMVNMAITDDADSAVVVPSPAVVADDADNCYVWVFNPEDSCVSRRSVAVDRLTADGMTLLSDGLATGEVIVAAGAHHLTDAQRVKPMEAPAKSNIGGLL